MMVEEGSHLPRAFHVACPYSGCALALAVSQAKAVLSQHKALSLTEPRFEMTIEPEEQARRCLDSAASYEPMAVVEQASGTRRCASQHDAGLFTSCFLHCLQKSTRPALIYLY